MKLFKTHRKAAVAALAATVALLAGGAAFAYFTTSGTGTGNAYVASAQTVAISQLTPNTQVGYNSIVPSPDTWGLSFGGTSTTDFGNKINLASSTALSNVVVPLDSQACETGTGTHCVTTPGATFPAGVTLSIYNTSGVLLTSDNQTFNVPYRPSASPTSCAAGTSNWTGGTYSNDGSQWYDATNGTCNYGITYDATFNSFSPGGYVLPSTVVYGISYDASTGPTSSLNVEMSNESTSVTVGSDADPGNVYLASTGAAGGTTGEITCSAVNGGFNEYSTAVGGGGTPSTSCGAQAPDSTTGTTQIADIPQVEFNTSASGSIALTPGGPGQSVDFSIGNAGSSPAYVQSVQIAVSQSSLPSGCAASWFTVVQPSSPFDVTIPAGTTADYQPSGAVVELQNLPVNQNACQGATVGLTFTSN
jgi:hypothetical protein